MEYEIKATYKRIAGEIGSGADPENERVIYWLNYYLNKKVPLFIQEDVIKRCIPIGKFTFEDVCELFANQEHFLEMCRVVYKKHRSILGIKGGTNGQRA